MAIFLDLAWIPPTTLVVLDSLTGTIQSSFSLLDLSLANSRSPIYSNGLLFDGTNVYMSIRSSGTRFKVMAFNVFPLSTANQWSWDFTLNTNGYGFSAIFGKDYKEMFVAGVEYRGSFNYACVVRI
jgi:hypothetical protein